MREHQSDHYRELVRGLGIPCDDAAPRIRPSAAATTAVGGLLGVDNPGAERLILFAPGAAYGQEKQWPAARVAELIARLVRDRDARCVLVGAAHDREAGRAIEAWLRGSAPQALERVHNVIGHTDLGGLVALAAHSRVCVTNDSGAMHVAAATGRPVVAIFGTTDERVTRPLGRGDVLTADVFCRPCHLRDCPIDHRCMKRTTVDTAFAAVTPGVGPPRSYQPVAPGTVYGGNPDILPYLQDGVLPPAANEAGWKDTIIMLPGQVTRIAVRYAPTDTLVTNPSGSYPFDPNGRATGPGPHTATYGIVTLSIMRTMR